MIILQYACSVKWEREGISKTPIRRTLKHISAYPEPGELLVLITESDGWPYKFNKVSYMKRDRALVSILYLLALRISEALRLKKNQFYRRKDRILVKEIRLSKSRFKHKARKEQFRQEGFLPLTKERSGFTKLVLEYLELLPKNALLFPFTRQRALQITHSILDIPNHWLRAFGEDFLYSEWDHDILAVSDYVKVDPRTLQEYIRKRWKKYGVV